MTSARATTFKSAFVPGPTPRSAASAAPRCESAFTKPTLTGALFPVSRYTSTRQSIVYPARPRSPSIRLRGKGHCGARLDIALGVAGNDANLVGRDDFSGNPVEGRFGVSSLSRRLIFGTLPRFPD
jgi:hypothetical protein